jgi:hypothetical protein
LFIEDMLPQGRRAEGFALLRTSNSVGVIIASSVIARSTVATSFMVAAGLVCSSAVIIVVSDAIRLRKSTASVPGSYADPPLT